ncbi:hypothetical protein [Streptomyces sp. NPDC093610]|uniref:hypothetical protein n=1 Tax=Streptomyces sp. NPDC093610 TaxID=3366048 RepID=UPI00382A0EF3
MTDRIDLSAGTLETMVRALVHDAIDNHRDDPQLLRIMIEEASFSQELLDTIDRHGRDRVEQLRDLLVRHADVRVRALPTAAELIVFTVEANTHKLMAAPQTVPVESFENELVDMLTRYLRGSGWRPGPVVVDRSRHRPRENPLAGPRRPLLFFRRPCERTRRWYP